VTPLRALAAALVLAFALGGPAGVRADAEPGARLQELLDKLPPERRAEAEEWIEKLTPDQREKILGRYEQLGDDQRAFLERAIAGAPAVDPVEAEADRRAANEARWAEMTEIEREAMRRVLRSFQSLPEVDQDALIDTHFARRTPDKRREVLNRLRDVPRLR
jgi:hypothetical protein